METPIQKANGPGQWAVRGDGRESREGSSLVAGEVRGVNIRRMWGNRFCGIWTAKPVKIL
jgi:hypothetical protein